MVFNCVVTFHSVPHTMTSSAMLGHGEVFFLFFFLSHPTDSGSADGESIEELGSMTVSQSDRERGERGSKPGRERYIYLKNIKATLGS